MRKAAGGCGLPERNTKQTQKVYIRPRACGSFDRRLGRPRAALPTSISKWEGSSNAVPDAMVAHLGTHMLRPGNDPEVVARKLLREKHGRTSFYAAISYPHWGR